MSRGVSDSDTTAGPAEPTPHPLALELAARLGAEALPRCLLLGIGRGRNLPPLLAAGAAVDAIEDDPERARAAIVRFAASAGVRVARARYAGPHPFSGPYAAALSTHALLHGTPTDVAAALAATHARLAPGAPFFFTLGNKRDPRFGTGVPVAPDTYVDETGSERGVAHCYLDATGVNALLAGFALEHLEERSGAAGAWAHDAADAERIVHWFVRAHRA
jgi:SAM-dependent methyltransferase